MKTGSGRDWSRFKKCRSQNWMAGGEGWGLEELYYPLPRLNRWLGFWNGKPQLFSYKCFGEKKRTCAFPYWMQIVGSVFRGHKCECSDALHAQMSWRVLILGNDSFNLKLCFMNKTVMVTVCMCGWGMLGSTGKQAVSWTREWGVLADSGSPLGFLVTQFISCCGMLSLQFHSISRKMYP